MTDDQLTFDLGAALDAKEEGIKRVCENNEEFLNIARGVAIGIARERGEVTNDDVRKACPVQPTHHNAWGGVFRVPLFVWTGKVRTSALVQGHGNLQKVWRLL